MSDEKTQQELERQGVLFTQLNRFYNWGRKGSIWPMAFGLACCAIEMMAAASSRYDIARFGSELFRASPRQADLMIVSGTVTKKMLPQIVRLFNQMPEPRYVISMGACATSGGPFRDGYNVVRGIDLYLPVDVYVPGCPPRPEALLHALITLQQQIEDQAISSVRWYGKHEAQEFAVPTFGKHGLEIDGATVDPVGGVPHMAPFVSPAMGGYGERSDNPTTLEHMAPFVSPAMGGYGERSDNPTTLEGNVPKPLMAAAVEEVFGNGKD
jgi:NADH-quinone oxidoreductase subunit B